MQQILDVVFQQVLRMSLTAGVCILAVLFLRLFLSRMPRSYAYGLWLLVAFRLVCPVSVGTECSLFNLCPEWMVKDAQDVVDDIMGHVIEYNMEGKDQDIYYAMGFNQDIQVNTHAHEVFTHEVRRDMDDFKVYLKQLKDVEAAKADIETKIKEYPEDSDEYKDLKLKMDAADKAYTYIRENVQKKFENQLTKCQSYIDETNVAVTDNGTRRSRLELIKNRLMGQKATFKDLQSSNEDIDVTEVAVQLKSSELTYEAALAATSKIMQTNLMNYI